MPPSRPAPKESDSSAPSCCFLERSEAPSLAEQITLYSAVLAGFEGKKVVVRTLDAGADKPLPFMPFSPEPNPAMGARGLRICMEAPEILATQLEAPQGGRRRHRRGAVGHGPMVADMSEAAWFRSECHRAGLSGPIGIMIEIPAVALRAKQLGTIADFFSIGSNDLTQYTFAADRQVGAVARLQDAWQPALLDLIATAAEGGKESDSPCGCGEAASDPILACVLVGLGVTSLSMSPGALAAVRAALRAHTLSQCQAAAVAARAAVSAAAAKEAAGTYLSGLADLGSRHGRLAADRSRADASDFKGLERQPACHIKFCYVPFSCGSTTACLLEKGLPHEC